MTPTCRFDLVPESGVLDLDALTWSKVRSLLLESQTSQEGPMG